MPTSPYSHIIQVINYLATTRPTSILDVGLGNGKFGFIARDFLDVMIGERYRKEQWQVKIDGIEVFSDYIQDHQKAIYDDIYIGNAFDVIDSLASYDLVFLGDVLEHFKREQAALFLDKCIAHCTAHMIVCIPLGESWKQPAIYGNPYEEHLSFWKLEDFKPFIQEYFIHEYDHGDYGVFLISKDDYIEYKIEELRQKTSDQHVGALAP